MEANKEVNVKGNGEEEKKVNGKLEEKSKEKEEPVKTVTSSHSSNSTTDGEMDSATISATATTSPHPASTIISKSTRTSSNVTISPSTSSTSNATHSSQTESEGPNGVDPEITVLKTSAALQHTDTTEIQPLTSTRQQAMSGLQTTTRPRTTTRQASTKRVESARGFQSTARPRTTSEEQTTTRPRSIVEEQTTASPRTTIGGQTAASPPSTHAIISTRSSGVSSTTTVASSSQPPTSSSTQAESASTTSSPATSSTGKASLTSKAMQESKTPRSVNSTFGNNKSSEETDALPSSSLVDPVSSPQSPQSPVSSNSPNLDGASDQKQGVDSTEGFTPTPVKTMEFSLSREESVQKLEPAVDNLTVLSEPTGQQTGDMRTDLAPSTETTQQPTANSANFTDEQFTDYTEEEATDQDYATINIVDGDISSALLEEPLDREEIRRVIEAVLEDSKVDGGRFESRHKRSPQGRRHRGVKVRRKAGSANRFAFRRSGR